MAVIFYVLDLRYHRIELTQVLIIDSCWSQTRSKLSSWNTLTMSHLREQEMAQTVLMLGAHGSHREWITFSVSYVYKLMKLEKKRSLQFIDEKSKIQRDPSDLSKTPQPIAQLVKNSPAMWETWVWSLGWEDPLEKGTAAHSSILAWRIPWTA